MTERRRHTWTSEDDELLQAVIEECGPTMCTYERIRDGWAAIDAVLAGQPIEANQIPSAGCNIKWKPGNEPEYF